ncbi:DUF1493 family protein [Massilia sp. METH4]|uniref:DUF1493 family protein n=1 Tax=Massilia sp. METH4 TaxID=3123041 RepID=UPI0030D50CE6
MTRVRQSNPELEQLMIRFVADELRCPLKCVNLSTSLFHDIGVNGDDAADFVDCFSDRFNVSLDGFEFDRYFGPERPGTLVEIFQVMFAKIFTSRRRSKFQRLEVIDLIRAAEDGRFMISAN